MISNQMRILILGSGGREFALCKELLGNTIFCLGENLNPGFKDLSESHYSCKNLTLVDIEKYILEWNIDYGIIGPEYLLYLGVADLFLKHNISCIGPLKSHARIETDKIYARKLLSNEYSNYMPRFYEINRLDLTEITSIINGFKEEYVIKPNGLYGGKGVKLSGEHLKSVTDTFQYCNEIINKGQSILIEEKLFGEEFSLMSFTDGNTVKHMPLVRDYKRAYANNKGPNTGSMGSISYADHKLPFLNDADIEESKYLNEVTLKLVNLDNPNGLYKGVIYGSYIKTKYGIKIIEYNARFGDPECINIFSILETPLSTIFEHINNQTLYTLDINYKNTNTICKYLVPEGYPTKPISNFIMNLESLTSTELNRLVFASINQYMTTTTSRTIAVIEHGNDLCTITNSINKLCTKINLYYRADIGYNSINYKDCGVNIDEGNRSFQLMINDIKSTYTKSVVNSVGDFGGIYDLNDHKGYPLLVCSTDGVGTKTSFVWKYFKESGLEDLGQDIVNHSINDILVKGAKPLFFLDYLGFNKLNAEHASLIVKGISKACSRANCALLGGETAEMPTVYAENQFDIVGTIVGKVLPTNLISGKISICSGDMVLALPSNSPHTNGYSLIRRLSDLHSFPKDVLEYFRRPHKSYLDEITKLETHVKILGLAHITGGGLIENPPRVLSDSLAFKLNQDSWEIPEPFKILQQYGNLSDHELYRTFNCGIGMLIIINKDSLETSLSILESYGVFQIGEIIDKIDERNVIIN